MIQKIKDYLSTHKEQYELLRYVIAGGLTTLLSMLVQYGFCFILAPKEPMTGSALRWVIDTINRADSAQMSIATAISWVIAVLFAFWINRVMVFRAKKAGGTVILKELGQFALSRVVSFLLFEQGMMLLIKAMGISNIWNRLVVLIFVTVFNYVVSKFWIFKGKSETEAPAEARK